MITVLISLKVNCTFPLSNIAYLSRFTGEIIFSTISSFHSKIRNSITFINRWLARLIRPRRICLGCYRCLSRIHLCLPLFFFLHHFINVRLIPVPISLLWFPSRLRNCRGSPENMYAELWNSLSNNNWS